MAVEARRNRNIGEAACALNAVYWHQGSHRRIWLIAQGCPLQATALFLRAKVKVTLLEWSSMVSPLGCALGVKFFSVLILSARGICYRSNLISQDTVQESKVQISVFLISRSLAFFVPQILFLFYVYICFHEGVYSVCVWVCTPSDTEARRRV